VDIQSYKNIGLKKEAVFAQMFLFVKNYFMKIALATLATGMKKIKC
jgi:hypothetical protein